MGQCRLERSPILEDASQITHLLNHASGNAGVQDKLYRRVSARIHRIASVKLAKENPGHSLQPTMLVNDTFLRLLKTPRNWKNRSQFFAIVATEIQRILIDHARHKNALKHGGDAFVQNLDAAEGYAITETQTSHVELSDVLELMQRDYEQSHAVFMLHFYGNWTFKEIAEEILEQPYSTIRRRWDFARAFLQMRLMDE